jgi:hypothetical protein
LPHRSSTSPPAHEPFSVDNHFETCSCRFSSFPPYPKDCCPQKSLIFQASWNRESSRGNLSSDFFSLSGSACWKPAGTVCTLKQNCQAQRSSHVTRLSQLLDAPVAIFGLPLPFWNSFQPCCTPPVSWKLNRCYLNKRLAL